MHQQKRCRSDGLEEWNQPLPAGRNQNLNSARAGGSSSTWISVNAPNNFPLISKAALSSSPETMLSEREKLPTPDPCVSRSRTTIGSLCGPDSTLSVLWKPRMDSVTASWDIRSGRQIQVFTWSKEHIWWSAEVRTGANHSADVKEGAGLRGWPLTAGKQTSWFPQINISTE